MKKLSLFFLMLALCTSASSWTAESREEFKCEALELESKGNNFFDERDFGEAEEYFDQAAFYYDAADCSDDAERLKELKDLAWHIRSYYKEGCNAENEADEVVKKVDDRLRSAGREYNRPLEMWELAGQYQHLHHTNYYDDLAEAEKQRVEGYKQALACYKEADALKEDLFFDEIRDVKRKLREIGEESDSEDSV